MPAHASNSVDSVTEQTFAERVLQAKRPVLIQFWATWCRPCRMVTPIVESLAAERSGEVDVVKIDLDEEPELAARNGITAVPALSCTPEAGASAPGPARPPQHVLDHKLTTTLQNGGEGK
ncbi:thioredoxin domain-containing protein [Nonomuraea sp. NPDC049152]|uniref:thioredoxin family protein n=1 Tax=Nonomuraea sp. NPDC049152 TaxID=3154350 RepID=UPI0033DCFA34